MNLLKFIFGLLLVLTSCSKDDEPIPTQPTTYTMQSYDGNVTASFGTLSYRVYYPKEFTGQTFVIHVSRGGNGIGDDRGQLMSYVERYVQKGYVVVQIDHRFAGNDINLIAQYRGEEIKFIGEKVANGTLSYGTFTGTIDGSKQGYIGHSGGCMEGLESAGVTMSHGNYLVPQIKAVYGMSPAGNNPDQFGITSNGFNGIGTTAIFLILGEQEKDVNGVGTFMATNWRLQAYQGMNTNGPRYQTFVKGQNTGHIDIPKDNADIQKYNLDNSEAFFDTYVKGLDRKSEIGNISMPPNNQVEKSSKGI
ncbi:hypothetical protein [Croceiramulus getboli]|nr:hypothetical protein P8624_13925 [Flavobacteriaceae bacterium YJPT1-3]